MPIGTDGSVYWISDNCDCLFEVIVYLFHPVEPHVMHLRERWTLQTVPTQRFQCGFYAGATGLGNVNVCYLAVWMNTAHYNNVLILR